MTLEDVAERLGKSKRTILRMVDDGRFPEPNIREGRLILWNDGVVERWLRRFRSLGERK